MKLNFFIKYLINILSIIIISMAGVVGIIFTTLYFDSFYSGYISNYSNILSYVINGLITMLTLISIAFIKRKNSIVYKSCVVVVFSVVIAIICLYILKFSGVLNKVNNVQTLREYIKSFGNLATIFFILIQFLQVVILPIPSFITVSAGVLIFGPLLCTIYSSIGIITGSICAYFIGRFFGVRVVKWLVGEKALNKALKLFRGKDKVILTFMFLFPFFPDDLLCFVSGITTIDSSYFILMIFITRIISISVYSFSINNSLIPYNTWWGIILWILFFLFVILTSIILYKKIKSKNYTNKKHQ